MDDKFNDRILIGDLACLSKFSFMNIYGCSAKKYDDYINYFGVDTLIVQLKIYNYEKDNFIFSYIGDA